MSALASRTRGLYGRRAMIALPDPAEDLTLLESAVRDAGALALDHFHDGTESWDKRPGHPVSEADLAVNRLLEARLRGARPDYGWLSEESRDDPHRRQVPRLWVVDPIDGTRAFLRGRHEFSVTVAVVEDGRPLAGVVFSPATDEFYSALRGAGTHLNGRRTRVSDRPAPAGMTILVSRSEMQKRHWGEVFDDCTVEPISSVALKLARVAGGQADATISLWPKSDWDLAGGQLLVEEAGGMVSAPDGAPLVYNAERPRHPGVLAAGPTLAGALRDRLARLLDGA